MMLLALLVLGIYVLPSVTARFAGSHTMEVNTTLGGPQKMKCGQCHQYIVDELNATNASDYVTGQHMAAALVATPEDVCVFCHTSSTGIAGAHTQVTVKPCTEATSCHGQNVSDYKKNVTGRLGDDSDAHSAWYNAMTTATDPTNRWTDAGAYTCLGCHTHMGVSFNITRPDEYQLNLTVTYTGAVTVDDLWINTSSTNETQSEASPGTKWN
jgi:hypothetical protein